VRGTAAAAAALWGSTGRPGADHRACRRSPTRSRPSSHPASRPRAALPASCVATQSATRGQELPAAATTPCGRHRDVPPCGATQFSRRWGSRAAGRRAARYGDAVLRARAASRSTLLHLPPWPPTGSFAGPEGSEGVEIGIGAGDGARTDQGEVIEWADKRGTGQRVAVELLTTVRLGPLRRLVVQRPLEAQHRVAATEVHPVLVGVGDVTTDELPVELRQHTGAGQSRTTARILAIPGLAINRSRSVGRRWLESGEPGGRGPRTRARVSTEAVHTAARVNVTWVTPLGEEVASTS
jgi:hypothetical protein